MHQHTVVASLAQRRAQPTAIRRRRKAHFIFHKNASVHAEEQATAACVEQLDSVLALKQRLKLE
jgi:hypothetical protein